MAASAAAGIVKALGGVRGTIFFSAALLALIALGIQSHRLGNAQDENKLLAGAVTGYEQAQQVNLGTIGTLQGKIEAMVLQRKLDREAANQAVAAAIAANEATAAQLATTTRELNDVYARIPSARAWGAVGVDASVLDKLPGNNRSR